MSGNILKEWKTQLYLSKYLPSKKKEMAKSPKAKIDAYTTKTVCSEGHAKKITNLIMEMIVLDLRPTAMVEGTGFIWLINYIEPIIIGFLQQCTLLVSSRRSTCKPKVPL